MWRAVRPSRVADMPAVVNPFWLRKGFEGLTFFGKILTPTQALADEFNTGFTALKNHEMIHLRQAQSCGDSWLRFYLLYLWYWLRALPANRKLKHGAYRWKPIATCTTSITLPKAKPTNGESSPKCQSKKESRYMNKKFQAHSAIFFANTIFGLGVPVTKLLLDEWVTPMGYMASRSLGACILFWLIAAFMPKEHVERKDLITILLGGLLGFVISQTLTAWSLDYTSPVYFSLIATLTPVAVMLCAALTLACCWVLQVLFSWY